MENSGKRISTEVECERLSLSRLRKGMRKEEDISLDFRVKKKIKRSKVFLVTKHVSMCTAYLNNGLNN